MRTLTALACLLLFPAAAPAADTLTLSVADAVLMSLANNRALAVERIGPELSRTGELAAAGAFDTTLSGEVAGSWETAPAAGGGSSGTDGQRLALGAARLLPTGTTLAVEASAAAAGDPASGQSRLGASVTQALLQGRGGAVNLATVRQARIDTALSEHELRGFAGDLVARVEQACWDYLLAGRRLDIAERSLRLAEAQFDEVRERVAVGRVAEIELAAAEAEAALRRETLINAKSALATGRLNLLLLLNPPGADPLGRGLAITDLPALPPEDADPVEAHVELAGRLRPELAQARLSLERGDLELVKTRNGLLPRLDLFAAIGKTGYADSLGGSLDLGGDGRDLSVGLTLRFPLENRTARAAQRRATLSRAQAGEALANLAQLVEVDVRGAWIEAARLRAQVDATAATLRLQEAKLHAETEKFRVGKSTAFLVAQAQRDLVQAENDAESAVAGCLKALVELYRLEGSLLDRRGLTVAGR